MIKKHLHILLSILLIFTTSEFLWYQQLLGDKEPIELDQEPTEVFQESEDSKKVSDWSLEAGDDYFVLTDFLHRPFLALYSHTFLLDGIDATFFSSRLFLLYKQLKIYH